MRREYDNVKGDFRLIRPLNEFDPVAIAYGAGCIFVCEEKRRQLFIEPGLYFTESKFSAFDLCDDIALRREIKWPLNRPWGGSHWFPPSASPFS